MRRRGLSSFLSGWNKVDPKMHIEIQKLLSSLFSSGTEIPMSKVMALTEARFRLLKEAEKKSFLKFLDSKIVITDNGRDLLNFKGS